MMQETKYLDFNGLQYYDTQIKDHINSKVSQETSLISDRVDTAEQNIATLQNQVATNSPVAGNGIEIDTIANNGGKSIRVNADGTYFEFSNKVLTLKDPWIRPEQSRLNANLATVPGVYSTCETNVPTSGEKYTVMTLTSTDSVTIDGNSYHPIMQIAFGHTESTPYYRIFHKTNITDASESITHDSGWHQMGADAISSLISRISILEGDMTSLKPIVALLQNEVEGTLDSQTGTRANDGLIQRVGSLENRELVVSAALNDLNSRLLETIQVGHISESGELPLFVDPQNKGYVNLPSLRYDADYHSLQLGNQYVIIPNVSTNDSGLMTNLDKKNLDDVTSLNYNLNLKYKEDTESYQDQSSTLDLHTLVRTTGSDLHIDIPGWANSSDNSKNFISISIGNILKKYWKDIHISRIVLNVANMSETEWRYYATVDSYAYFGKYVVYIDIYSFGWKKVQCIIKANCLNLQTGSVTDLVLDTTTPTTSNFGKQIREYQGIYNLDTSAWDSLSEVGMYSTGQP